MPPRPHRSSRLLMLPAERSRLRLALPRTPRPSSVCLPSPCCKPWLVNLLAVNVVIDSDGLHSALCSWLQNLCVLVFSFVSISEWRRVRDVDQEGGEVTRLPALVSECRASAGGAGVAIILVGISYLGRKQDEAPAGSCFGPHMFVGTQRPNNRRDAAMRIAIHAAVLSVLVES